MDGVSCWCSDCGEPEGSADAITLTRYVDTFKVVAQWECSNCGNPNERKVGFYLRGSESPLGEDPYLEKMILDGVKYELAEYTQGDPVQSEKHLLRGDSVFKIDEDRILIPPQNVTISFDPLADTFALSFSCPTCFKAHDYKPHINSELGKRRLRVLVDRNVRRGCNVKIQIAEHALAATGLGGVIAVEDANDMLELGSVLLGDDADEILWRELLPTPEATITESSTTTWQNPQPGFEPPEGIGRALA